MIISLMLIGSDGNPRWAGYMRSVPGGAEQRKCCPEGHFTPEAAAGHVVELAALALVREVREAGPGTAGALAIAQLEG